MVVQLVWSLFVAPSTIMTAFGFLIAAIPALMVVPFFSILIVVLYINLRVEKEGLDQQALASDMGEPTQEEAEMTVSGGAGDNEEGDSEENGDVTLPKIV